MPVFMRTGCNTGSCHGAARGKDGFMLSLFGYDPDGDYYRLTHEIGFRRDQSGPAARKPAAGQDRRHRAAHRRQAAGRDSEYYATLLRWLEAGVPQGSGRDVPKVERVELFPPAPCWKGKEQRSSSSCGRITPTAPTAT